MKLVLVLLLVAACLVVGAHTLGWGALPWLADAGPKQAVLGQRPTPAGNGPAFGAPRLGPSEARIASRLVTLVAVAARAGAEYDGRDLHEARSGILRWIGEAGSPDEAEGHESAVLLGPPGGIEAGELASASWQIEGAVVLAWALGLVEELPPHDEALDPMVLGSGLGFLDTERTRTVLRSTSRRHEALIDVEAARYDSMYWRLQEFTVTGKALDLDSFARSGATGRLRFERVPMVDGDMAVTGQPIYSADPVALAESLRITAERLRALRWLRTGGRYSAVQLDDEAEPGGARARPTDEL